MVMDYIIAVVALITLGAVIVFFKTAVCPACGRWYWQEKLIADTYYPLSKRVKSYTLQSTCPECGTVTMYYED
jgi:rRNA maturation protein Nop10